MGDSELWLEFLDPKTSLCGLCGNHGIVDTVDKLRSPVGTVCGVRQFCICPNGRKMKEVGWRLEKESSVES